MSSRGSRSSRGSPSSRGSASSGNRRSKDSFFESKMFYALVAAVLLVSAVFFFYKVPKERFTNQAAHVPSQSEPHLEYFFLQTCGHCKDFSPIWDDAVAQIAKDSSLKVKTIKYDANDKETGGEARAKFFGINQFPTVYYVYGPAKTDYKEYNGPRKADAILAYVKSQATTSAPPAQ